MRVGGKDITKCEEILVLPRAREEDTLVFRAVPVAINEEFSTKVPEPVAPLIQKKDDSYRDVSDKEYRAAIKRRGEQKFSLMLLRSLEPSEIEWETIDFDKPTTWTNWNKELQDAGLSETECNRIAGIVMVANSLDETKIRMARESFLLGQGR